MGRRALRKIPNVDLSRHLLELDQLPPPGTPLDLFERVAPLEVEVGSGKGLFLATASVERPDANFLGVEIEKKYAAYAAARLARNQQSNARMLHGDAQRFFAEWLAGESIAAVHVYFPDPWWKKRHRKRRVFNERFVRQIERVLLPGGRLHFWTDVEEYFQVTLEMLAAETALAGPLEVEERPSAHDLDYRTHFERRVRQAGQPVYRAEYSKGAPKPPLERPPSAAT